MAPACSGRYRHMCECIAGVEMTTAEELYCNACHLAIGLQKHATLKNPQTKGKRESSAELLHFHNRAADDCWGKQLRQLLKRYNGKTK